MKNGFSQIKVSFFAFFLIAGLTGSRLKAQPSIQWQKCLGGSGDDKPIESMSLNFASIEHEYFKQDDKGITKSAGKGTWDQQKAKTK